MVSNKWLILVVSFFAAAIVLTFILSVPIGVADGGSLYKTLEGLGLGYQDTPSADYFEVEFNIYDDAKITDTPSAISAIAIDKTAKVFDVRRLAAIYSVLFIFGLLLAIRGGIKNDVFDIPFAALCIFIFADTAYTAYFNTFYSEGAIHTTYIVMCAFIILSYNAKAVVPFLAILSAVFTLVFAFCGTAQAWIAVLFGFLISRLYRLCENKLHKVICIVAGAISVLLAITFAFNYKSEVYEKNIYNAVFFGVAQHESITTLGLNSSLDELCGVFYSDEILNKYNLQNEFYNKISYSKITKFYLTRPMALGSKINTAIKNAYNMRPSYLGNYTKDSIKDKRQAGFFSLYSSFKSKFIPNTAVFAVIFFALYFGVLLYTYLNEKGYRPIIEFAFCLGFAAVLSLIIPIIISGSAEIGKELFLFCLLFDSIVVFSVTAGGRYMYRRKKMLQNKYGLNSD
ncbi:MAG: hypothetical protein M0R40_03155 [Firmicutes bacterium]|nr:hypothetical protein [Bacillota bacterium]